MKTLFDPEATTHFAKAVTITGGWMFAWTGLLLLLALM